MWDEKMWEDVRRCEKMWEDVRRCEKMWEDVRRCEKMWEEVKMRRCEWRCEKMWEDVRRCEDEKMWRWENEEMRRCEDEKMRRRCEDEKMWRWEDVSQTPTIGRTLRSDAHWRKNWGYWWVMLCNHDDFRYVGQGFNSGKSDDERLDFEVYHGIPSFQTAGISLWLEDLADILW